MLDVKFICVATLVKYFRSLSNMSWVVVYYRMSLYTFLGALSNILGALPNLSQALYSMSGLCITETLHSASQCSFFVLLISSFTYTSSKT